MNTNRDSSWNIGNTNKDRGWNTRNGAAGDSNKLNIVPDESAERGKRIKCKATIEFGDDFGDNTCTFHCELEKGHKGLHKETGTQYGVPYTLTWGTIEPEEAREVSAEGIVKV